MIFRIIEMGRDDIFKLMLEVNPNLLKIKHEETGKYPI